MRSAEDDINRFIERIRPFLTGLYRRAEVIVANESFAEYIVQNAITEAYPLYLEGRGRAAFQEGLYALVRNIALDELNSNRNMEDYAQDAEETVEQSLYLNAPYTQDDAIESALYTRVMREKYLLRRMLMLKYGCGLNATQIGNVLNMRAGDVRQRLRILNARLFRGARGTQIPALEQRLSQMSIAALNRQSDDVPDMTTIFQLFAENIQSLRGVKRRAPVILHAVLMIVGGLLCAMLFWLISILLVPGDEMLTNTERSGSEIIVNNTYFI